MTARKLHTPGVRETAGGEGSGAGAGGADGGGADPRRQLQNLDGGAAAGGAHGRSSIGSSHAGLMSYIMQPLPLASRCVAKNDSLYPPSSALGSAWIRRFLPSSPAVSGGELSRAPVPVPRAPSDGRGGSSGPRPADALPVALAPEERKDQDVAMAEEGMAVDSSRETTAMGSGNGHYILKGKALQEWGHRHEMTAGGHDLEKIESRNSYRKGTAVSSHPRNYDAEGSGRQPQPEADLGAGSSTLVESPANVTSGAVVTGFGSLRVVIRPATSECPKVAGSSPELRAPAMEGGTETEPDVPAAPPDGFRLFNAVVPERKLTFSQLMATGTKFTPLPKLDLSRDLQLESQAVRPSREFPGARGFPKGQQKEIDSERGRPGTVPTDGAREAAVPFGGSKGGEPAARFKTFNDDYFSHRPDSLYHNYYGSGVERAMPGCKLPGERFVPTYPPAKTGRKEEAGQATENRHQSRAAADAGARPSSGAGYTKGGPENMKMKVVVGSEHSGFRRTDVGGPSQQQQQLSQDGPDGRAGQSDQKAPWKSFFTVFKGRKHSDLPTSMVPFPPDVHSRLHSASVPVNPYSEDPEAEDGSGGGRGRREGTLPASSDDVRSRFDNPSSHFSSSPWPDNESHHPNDDVGSCPYNSQGTGSAYQSQASRVANRTASESKGQNMSTYRYDSGRGVSDAPVRWRDPSASEPDPGKSAGSPGEDARESQMPNDENQAHGSPETPRHFNMQPLSGGQRDYTSGSSPPSCPVGYNNSSDLASPVFNERAGQSKTVEVNSEMDGSQHPTRQAGQGNASVGFYPSRWRGNTDLPKDDNEAVYGDYRDASALLGKDLDAQKAHFTAREMYRDLSKRARPSEGDETGPRHGKLRTSDQVMGEPGASGPSKRSCHPPILNSRREVAGLSSGEHGTGIHTVQHSSWLQRWLPASNGHAGKPPAAFAIPKDRPGNGFTAMTPRSTGRKNFMVFSNDGNMQATNVQRGKRIEEGNVSKVRSGPRDISGRRLIGLPPYPTPSAAAMALVSTATRKIGP